MKKIKIFKSSYLEYLESIINEFIEKHPNVIDIQYSTTSPYEYVTVYSAMIIYEDGDSN